MDPMRAPDAKTDYVALLRGSQEQGSEWFDDYLYVVMKMIAEYPESLPDAVTQKRYYYYLANMGSQMPPGPQRDGYEAALAIYPVAPFLDGRNDMYHWTHLVSNHVLHTTRAPTRDVEGWTNWYKERDTPRSDRREKAEAGRSRYRKHAIFGVVVVTLIIAIRIAVSL